MNRLLPLSFFSQLKNVIDLLLLYFILFLSDFVMALQQFDPIFKFADLVSCICFFVLCLQHFDAVLVQVGHIVHGRLLRDQSLSVI